MGNLIRWVAPETGTTWDRVRIYSAATIAGPFTLVKEIDISNTFYWDEQASSTTYYELSFYDSTTPFESAPTAPFTISTTPVITPKELRWFMGLKDTEDPNDDRLVSLIVDASTEFQVDDPGLASTNKRLALKYLSAIYVSNWRAQQLLGSGNVNFAIDGVSIQKPYLYWQQRVKDYREQYDHFLYKFMEHSSITTPISDGGYPDYATELVRIISGLNNAQNHQDVRTLSNSDTAFIPTLP